MSKIPRRPGQVRCLRLVVHIPKASDGLNNKAREERSEEDGKASACTERYNYGHKGDHMRVSTVREFRDKATGFLRSDEPVLITRRGRMAGVFFPAPGGTLPLDLKRILFDQLSAEIHRLIQQSKCSEEEILEDFESWRKARRETRRRR